MIPVDLSSKLAELMALPAENEWAEFKKAKDGYDFEKLGKYFSALSNEANLKDNDIDDVVDRRIPLRFNGLMLAADFKPSKDQS